MDKANKKRTSAIEELLFLKSEKHKKYGIPDSEVDFKTEISPSSSLSRIVYDNATLITEIEIWEVKGNPMHFGLHGGRLWKKANSVRANLIVSAITPISFPRDIKSITEKIPRRATNYQSITQLDYRDLLPSILNLDHVSQWFNKPICDRLEPPKTQES